MSEGFPENMDALRTADEDELHGESISIQSTDTEVCGTIIEVHDDAQGIRHVLIEKETGVVKAIPIWTVQ